MALNNNPQINIAFSNISFEIWILLHFDKKNRFFKNSDQIIKYLLDTHKFEYSKTMNIYESLKKYIDKALENAEWLMAQNNYELSCEKKPYDLNSYTNFNELYLFLKKTLKQ